MTRRMQGTTPGTPAPASRRKPGSGPGIRAKLAYALAAVLLLPITAGYLYWAESTSLGDGTADPEPLTAAKGEPLTYEDTTWKLTFVGKGPVAEGERLPDNAKLIYATIEVTPRTAAASKRIEMCGFEAADGAGRTWHTDEMAADLEAVDNPVTGCYAEKGEFDTGPIPAGEKQPVLAVFVVPKDAVPDLRVQVRLGRDDPLLELAS